MYISIPVRLPTTTAVVIAAAWLLSSCTLEDSVRPVKRTPLPKTTTPVPPPPAPPPPAPTVAPVPTAPTAPTAPTPPRAEVEPAEARITIMRPAVRGSLPPEVVRRMAQRHVGELRRCYQQGLTRNAALMGQVVVQATVAATGQVVVCRIQESTVKDAVVEQCMTQAVRRWKFPRPRGGGIVIVSLPFALAGS